ncbi:putative FBD domain-containing protein [Helianthus anomalus]
MKCRRKIRRVAVPRVHKHLKRLEMSGYDGRISDLELAVYVRHNAATLKKIDIDPCCQAFGGRLSKEDCLKRLPAARSSAKHQLTPLLPPGVDMVNTLIRHLNTGVTVAWCVMSKMGARYILYCLIASIYPS